jgi:hypothetical protein
MHGPDRAVAAGVEEVLLVGEPVEARALELAQVVLDLVDQDRGQVSVEPGRGLGVVAGHDALLGCRRAMRGG